jgi:hypothetical protein
VWRFTGRVEIQHHLFLTSALDGGSELDASAALLPTPTPPLGKNTHMHEIEDCIGPQNQFGHIGEREKSLAATGI